MIATAPAAPSVKTAAVSEAAAKARELAGIHQSVCRYRQANLVCSICTRTQALAANLEARRD